MAQNDPPPVFRVGQGERYEALGTFEMEEGRRNSLNMRAYNTINDCCDALSTNTWILDCEALVTIILITAFTTAAFAGIVVWSFNDSIDKEETNHVGLVLSSMSISNFEVSRTDIKGHCSLSFNITNHGENQLYFGKSLLSVYFDHELLWVTKTDPLYLDVEQSASLNVSVKEDAISISDEFVPTALLWSKNSNQTANFLVKFDGVLRDGVGTWLEERDQMYAICGWVNMKFQNATTLSGGPVKCEPKVI